MGSDFWTPLGEPLAQPAFDKPRWGGLPDPKPGQKRLWAMARLVGEVPPGDLPEGVQGGQASVSLAGGFSTGDHTIAGKSIAASQVVILDLPESDETTTLALRANAAPWQSLGPVSVEHMTGRALTGGESNESVIVSRPGGKPGDPNASQLLLASNSDRAELMAVVKDDADAWHGPGGGSASDGPHSHRMAELVLQSIPFDVAPWRIKQVLVLARRPYRVSVSVAAAPNVQVQPDALVTPPTRSVEAVQE